MNVGFEFNEPQDGKRTPVYFEQVIAEKPAGGLIANPSFDVEPTTALGVGSDGLYHPIKGYRLVAAVASADTKIKIAKGSGVAVGDFIANGKKAVACSAVDKSNADYDEVTVSLALTIAKGTVLYQSGVASTTGQSAVDASPIYTPVYVAGGYAIAGKGDQRVRLINGANIRKATACIADEVAALMPMITLV